MSDSEEKSATPTYATLSTLAGVMTVLATLQFTFGWTGGSYSAFLAFVFGLSAFGAWAGRNKPGRP